MADYNACATCLYMQGLNDALVGVDRTIFNNLQSPVVATFAGIATVAFMFSTQIRTYVKTFAPEMEQQRWFMQLWLQSGKLVLVGIALTSYAFWHDWVINFMNLIIFEIAGAVTAGGLLEETKGDIFSSGGNTELFERMMATVHAATYEPIEKLNSALSNLKFGVRDIVAGIGVGLGQITLSMFASTANLFFFLILAMHKIMTVFVVGMGPLILALWVFDATKHYAYSFIRFLAATGSIVVGASFLMGLSVAVVQTSVEQIPMKLDIEPPQVDVKGLSDWVLSGGMQFAIGAYMAMALMMLLAVLIGASVVLAQRPQLEK